MLNCQQTTQLLSEQQDRVLLKQEKRNVQMHLMLCISCRRFGRQIKTLSQVSKTFRYVDDQQ